VARQARNGYVVEYISRTIEKPNPGFENDPVYLQDLEERAPLAGRLIAVHRLRPSARALREIIGSTSFERLQDIWARDGNRHRWSVAFPIIESFAIIDRPYASEVFGAESYQKLLAHASALLRPLDVNQREALADLTIISRPADNAWIAIEDEAAWAAGSDIDERTRRDIDEDLIVSAMEGLTDEQRSKVRLRAAWLAQRFVRVRVKAGSLNCDDCNFDPVGRTAGLGVNPRSLMDVHHRKPLAEGKRHTEATAEYFKLLCPICHRLEHAIMRVAKKESQQTGTR
jgi:5-methylcytosine-specific restriction protein A